MAIPKNPRRVFPIYHERVHQKVKGIQGFLLRHVDDTVSWNPRKILQLKSLRRDLRAQFQRMEATWDDMKANPVNEPIFDEVEGWISTDEEAMMTALRDSEAFL